MAQVILENIYKNFPLSDRSQPEDQAAAIAVLRAINLTVSDGEFMVLVGPSGCGKSTLLRLIAGLEELTGGNIWVGDRLINNLPPKDRDIAMVFQNYALYPHMTVYDNLAFGLRRTTAAAPTRWPSWVENLLVATTRPLPARLHYKSARENTISQCVQRVAQMLQIAPLLHRRPKQLSGGQKQRVALGRAMARNPQVFLMDEPLSNLDAKLRAETRAQIVKLQRQLGTTTIYVTHDQTEAMTMGDRIAVMNAGQIQQIATPLDLYNYPANRFVAAFIGSPPMNFLPVTVTDLLITHAQFQLTLPKMWAAVLQPYHGHSVILGIRPEHLTTGGPAPHHLRVQVELIEALGHETCLAVTLGDTPLQVRVAPQHPVPLGGNLWLAIASEKIHLFDAETGLALTPLR